MAIIEGEVNDFIKEGVSFTVVDKTHAEPAAFLYDLITLKPETIEILKGPADIYGPEYRKLITSPRFSGKEPLISEWTAPKEIAEFGSLNQMGAFSLIRPIILNFIGRPLTSPKPLGIAAMRCR